MYIYLCIDIYVYIYINIFPHEYVYIDRCVTFSVASTMSWSLRPIQSSYSPNSPELAPAKIKSLGLRVSALVLSLQGVGCRVQDLGCRV